MLSVSLGLETLSLGLSLGLKPQSWSLSRAVHDYIEVNHNNRQTE